MMHRLTTRLQLPAVLLLAGLLALFALALTGCGSTKPAPATALAEKTPTEKESGKKGPSGATGADSSFSSPQQAATNPPHFWGIGAAARLHAWADAERARQGIAPVPRKVKRGAVVTIASGNGTASTTAATAKNAAAASDSATVLNAPKAQQAALAGAGATITQTPPRTWSWWLLLPAGLAMYGMYRTLKA